MSFSTLLFGPDGKVRPLLCALLYAVLAFWVLSADWFMGPPLERLANTLQVTGLSAGGTAFYETVNLATALLLTGLFAWYEQRRIDSYGFPIREAFGARFWEGFAIGVITAGAVAIGMIALGGMTVHGLALHGSRLLWASVAWFGANVLVGVAEELLFRGYLLQSLRKSLGFWPAALCISAWFAADHYFFKQGENLWDVITLFSLGLWLCYSVLRTGTLWLAIGEHAAFDYMQIFIIGTPNGGIAPTGHLLNVSFHGPAWITGGELGTEASFLMYPTIALMFLYIAWRFQRGINNV
ncbi:MAG TPA: CPBP family intramembrane glutamic endopeptidase [Steroidobacteraceae bacterium]